MDWNNDGHLDILSGCYWTDDADGGQIQMLAGSGTLDFAEAESLQNADGKPLQNIELSGELDSSGMPDNQIKTICTHQHAVDYDHDGDLDLVVGCFGPEFFLYENSGSNDAIQLSPAPVELPVKSTSHHSAPHLVDWDGDGDLDLLSGSAEGGAIISENTGTRAKPDWSPFRQLIPPTNRHEQSAAGGREIKPSPGTRIWATDWNGDGLLDLLVGDHANITNPIDGIDPDEYERRLKEVEKQMAALQVKQQPLYEKYLKLMESGQEPDEEMQAELQEVSQQAMEIQNGKAEFQDIHMTGFVWLYIRKPASDRTLAADSGSE